MRILIVHPGADVSTVDVYNGLNQAFLRRGDTELIYYNLSSRLQFANDWLEAAWKRGKKNNPDLPHPGAPDTLYLAGQGILERALRHEVDWVLVISGMYLHPDWLILLQRAGIRVATLLTESPYDDEHQGPVASYCNMVWTNESGSVSYLQRYNPRTKYLPHAFDPNIHSTAPAPEAADLPAHDVVFVGTGFIERIKTLSAVNWDGIDFGLYGTWPMIGSRSKLRRHIAGGYVKNNTASQMYHRAKIGLNLYRTSMGFGRNVRHIPYAASLNPRALELAATGVFTISDWRPEVEQIFGPLVPTFRTPKEMEDLIRYYLDHSQERERIAQDLPATVAGMTYDARVEQILGDLAALDAPPTLV